MAVVLIAAFSILGCLFGINRLVDWRNGYKPMPVNSALLFILLGNSLIFFFSKGSVKKLFFKSVIPLVSVVATERLCEFIFGWRLAFDYWYLGFRYPDNFSVLKSSMSFFGAINFLLSAASLYFLSTISHRQIYLRLGKLFSYATLVIGVAFAFDYLYRDPSQIKDPDQLPMALNASVNFYILGLGLSLISYRREKREQWLARKTLTESEEKFRSIVETTNEWIWSIRTDGIQIYNNPAVKAILGYFPEELFGKDRFLYMHDEDRERFQMLIPRFIATRKGWSGIVSRWKHKDGSYRHLESNAVPILDPTGKLVGFRGADRDVTNRLETEKSLEFLSSHDPLTKLYNRNKLIPSLEWAIHKAQQGSKSALIYIDLDNFKIINDTLGHAAGDRLLVDIAFILQKNARSHDLVLRFGGDEFVVLVYEAELNLAHEFAEKLRKLIEDHTFQDVDRTFNVSASIGLTLIDPTKTAEQIVVAADSACFAAKKRGRNRVEVGNQEGAREISLMASDSDWSKLIKEAMVSNELELWVQPIIQIKTGEIVFFEALLRLSDKEGKVVMPGAFLPSVERTGVANLLDRHVLALGAELLKNNSELNLTINITAQSLNEDGFKEYVDKLFQVNGVESARVILEITESVAISNMERARVVLYYLQSRGFRFALDDFGSGFLSFVHLRELPVDLLKIDGTFIPRLKQQPLNQALVQSINEVAHILKRKTVAEFVDSAETLELLSEIGIDYAQGNFLGAASRVDPALLTKGRWN